MKLVQLTGCSDGRTVDLTTADGLSLFWSLYLRVNPTSTVSLFDAFGISSSSAELQGIKMIQFNNTKSMSVRFIEH